MAAKLKRVSHALRVVFATALLTVATYAIAQELRADHPDTYVVKRGDTLWDIAGRFLKRPWLWPEIWQANPQVKNPHLIYPGDVLSLAYLNRVGVQPGPRTEAPVPVVSLAEIEPFLKDLRMYDRINNLPYVVGLEDDRLRGVRGQMAYVRGLADAKQGQRFAVLRPLQIYTMGRRRDCCAVVGKDDLNFAGDRDRIDFERYWTEKLVTNHKGMEQLGIEMVKVNAGVITRGEVGGIEASTLLLDDRNREVRIGDKVVPVESIPYDLQFFPHPPKQQFAYQQAQVLSVADMLGTGGPRDVVALSVGSRDGVDNGTVFSIWRVGSNVSDRVAMGDRRTLTDDQHLSFRNANRIRLPDEFAGHVMVFRTFDKVSYGLVMESIKPTRVGYELKHPDATY